MDIIQILSNISVVNLIVGITTLYLLYRYSTRNYDYWRKRGIPYIKPYPFIGSFLDIFTKNFEEVEINRYNKYGKVYGIYEGNKPSIVVGEPELLRQIFVKDFQYFPIRRTFDFGDEVVNRMLTVVKGDDWKRIRTIVSPTFSTGKIKRLLSIFQDCSKTLIQNLKMSAIANESTDVLSLLGAFTMDIIASSAFSTKIDSHNDPQNRFVKNARAAFSRGGGNFRVLIFFIFPDIMKKLGLGAFGRENMEFFKNVTLEIIAERRKTGQTRNDFLQLLIDAATEGAKEEKFEEKSDDVIANYGDDSIDHEVFKYTSNKHLSMDELVAQCLVFFLAGFHTTATTLGISSYLLALNQDAQDKLLREIKDVLSQTNGELTYEAVQKMKYLDNCISEVLRLYPPLQRLDRTSDAEYKLGDTGITIPKGMVINIPVYAMHHDPKLFPDPEKFNPDRFCIEDREKQVPYTYLPFGAGPRNCVGMRFALIEIKVCLIYMFSAFHVQRSPETKVPLDTGDGKGFMQPAPIKLRLTPREDCPLKP